MSETASQQPPPVTPASQKILVVDDEADVTELLAYHLQAKGFTVETLNDPNRSLGLARTFLPDLVILDVMMPDLSGIQLCRLIRADPQLAQVPVIFLTAKAEEGDRIQGLETGADDYICKPFSIKELILRVQTILRRLAAPGASSGQTAEPLRRILQAGQITLDTESHEAALAGTPIDLTATEFKLLQILMERRGRVQTREHLLINVWNYETEIETRTVDTHVRRLREKLGDHADLIETIRGVGYRLAK
ncbi:DNA-binding response regulator [Opitutaceae bacterium TAV4]|uniref:response regulator n=1 Tax=Geminisphaera colitermitum TaxID=1148786 RepID=UPI0005BAA41E|nr:response regulator transcription factor [Geminisphaera colitermitum]RRJ94844.1 DNA-binding response regulator [Opitutaceae bacterium TAV4]RRJ99075.1 DNA-binding response regulator [Opitutaceae bacterium TAV3]